jgi:hypothetical protein
MSETEITILIKFLTLKVLAIKSKRKTLNTLKVTSHIDCIRN